MLQLRRRIDQCQDARVFNVRAQALDALGHQFQVPTADGNDVNSPLWWKRIAKNHGGIELDTDYPAT
jgi:hypothetical protein